MSDRVQRVRVPHFPGPDGTRITLAHLPPRGLKRWLPILTAIYHMLKNGTLYEDPGPNHFDARTKERQKDRLLKRLADLGYAVELVRPTQ
jgi:hypothetical protein